MKFKNWKDIAELIGIAAIIASLVFVGLQMRQAEHIARSEMNAAVLANNIEANNAVIEHADVWVRGNAGEELDQVEAAIFERQVLNMNDKAYYEVQQNKLLGLDWQNDLNIAQYAAYLFENPGARRVWRAREQKLQRYRGLIVPEEQITSEWIEAVESKLAVFERAEHR